MSLATGPVIDAALLDEGYMTDEYLHVLASMRGGQAAADL
jgi:hypothetical protein